MSPSLRVPILNWQAPQRLTAMLLRRQFDVAHTHCAKRRRQESYLLTEHLLYRHLQGRVTGLLAELGQTGCVMAKR